VALLSHCERGEEYIVGQGAHNYLYEAGGAAVLGSIQPQPIDAAPDGSLPLDKVAAKIKADDIHFARTKLLSLENTHNGKVLPREYLKAAWEFTRERKLGLHVDGARIFNAIVEYGCELKESCNIATRSLSASPKVWARRWVHCWWAMRITSSVQIAGVK
jgi:threonine aldolase